MAKHLILFLSFLTCLHAEIIETAKMEEILPYVDETTWVLFDIDDTLLESELQAGRTKWFYHEFGKRLSQGIDKNEAILSIDSEYLKIIDLCPIRTPEPEIIPLLERIQQTSGAVLGLTARGPNLCPATLKQLARLGINLSISAPNIPLSEFGSAGHYEQGILFSIDLKKGPALRRLLEKAAAQPKKIVFVDDQRKHLAEAEEILSSLDIPFVGFHYTKTLERPFDHIQADIDHKALIEQSKSQLSSP